MIKLIFDMNSGEVLVQHNRKINICKNYGHGCVNIRKYQRWFKTFRNENFNLLDEPT